MFNTKIKKLFICLAVLATLGVSLFFVSQVLAQDALGVDAVGQQTGLGTQDIKVTIGKIIKVILGFLGVVAICLVLYGGFMYMTAGGDETKVTKARKVLINAGIGLVIIFSAYAIVSFVTSRLLEATGANEANQEGGGGGGGGGLDAANLNAFVSRVISPTGAIAIRNVKVRITFSKEVSANLVNAGTIKITNPDGALVAGSFDVNGKKAIFTPDAACPAPNQALKCFDANKKYKVSLTPKAIKSTNGIELSCAGGSVCLAEFTTGELVDVTAPEVTFVMPLNDMKVSVNDVVGVTVAAVDDAGISNISLSVDGSLLDEEGFNGGTPKEAMFDWSTENLALGFHTLRGEANDIDDHTGNKEIRVKVLPEICFGDNGEVICGRAAECGACENGPCRGDADCAAGFYCLIQQGANEGQCTSLPVITNVAPAEGAAGNMVTIVGSGFKNFVNGTSKVFFANGVDAQNKPTYIEAGVPDCGALTWTDNRILTKVPAGVKTGPIKVVNKDNKWDSTDNTRGWKDDFVLNSKLINPGLCSVFLENCNCEDAACKNCLNGDIRQNIKAAGENFGTQNDQQFADYHVYFGEITGALAAGGAWREKEIRNVKIPNLAEGSVNVVVGKGERCLDRDNETCQKGVAGCVCSGVYSNPAPFRIASMVILPIVKEITPRPARAGQVISIDGENFGKAVGAVTLINAVGDSVALGLGCENDNSWMDSQILVKLPEPLAVGNYRIIVTTSERLASEPANLAVAAGVPGPALCRINPTNGPRGTAVNFFGKNFGGMDDYKIYFAKTGVKDNPNTAEIEKDPGTAVLAANIEAWTETSITKAKVPQDAISGKVILANDDKSVESNGLLFSVGSCSGNSCGADKKCCPNGVCVAAEGGVCADAGTNPSLSEFGWVVSTGNLPRILQIVERRCVVGALSQSPSPTLGAIDACPNGMISGTFNQLINKATLSNNIVIKRCTSPVGTKRCKENTNTVCATDSAGCKCIDLGICDLDQCNANCVQSVINNVQAADIGETNQDAVCLKAGAACEAGSAGCVCAGAGDRLSEFRLVSSLVGNAQLLENNALFKNNWYSVTVKGGVGGVKNATNEAMPYDYTWKFKTRTENCVPDKLLVSPAKGLIEEINGEQAYMVSGQYKCESIALNNENWAWTVNDPVQPKRAKFLDFGQTDAGVARKDIGNIGLEKALPKIPETTNETLIDVVAAARIAGSAALSGNVSKAGKLEINFSDPEVTESYPNCTEACINASIGAKFNTEMKADSFIAGAAVPVANRTVLIYECAASDCVVLARDPVAISGVAYQYAPINADESLSEATISLANNLNPNKFYRVILKDGILATNGGKLSKLNYNTNLDEAAPKNAYSWTFKTRDDAEPCKVNTVDVVPENYISSTAREKINYSGQPRSAGDACKKEGQLLDPADYAWTWESSNPLVAKINTVNLFGAVPSYCTNNCLSNGSQPFGGVCGNSRVEKGEECDDGNLLNTDNCSDICLKLEFPICANLVGDVNCCGNGIKEGQEECDLGCTYKNEKNEACVKGSANCFCVSKESSCANGCLNAGTGAGFVCGNGKVEAGEDCDDGNKTAGDGCSVKCLNEGAKYQTYVEGGQTKSPIVCGDGVIQGGEECESICKTAAGVDCNFGENGCVCAKNQYCSDRCVWAGFPKCTATNKTTKAVCCGDGVKENYIGTDAVDEECEAVCTKQEACDPGEGCNNGKWVVSCNFLNDAACTTCIFPATCNDKCLNTGSNVATGAVCRDGLIVDGNGEDEQCEGAQGGAGRQSPNQIVEVVGDIADELYDAEKRFAEDITKIGAVATELVVKAGEQAVSKNGETDLAFRKYSCTLTAGPVALDFDNTVPRKDSVNICRNAMIYMTINQKIASEGFTRDQVIVKYAAAGGVCAVDEILNAGNCVVSVLDAKILEENTKSIIAITPKGLLPANKTINVEVNNLKDSCGASFNLREFSFVTSDKLCRLTEVTLTPWERFITDPDRVELYTAIAKSEQKNCLKNNVACKEGDPGCVCNIIKTAIHGVANVYDWNWNWTKGDATIVTSITPSAPIADSAQVATAKKNGQTTVTATATISVDRLGAQLGQAGNEFDRVCLNNNNQSRCQEGAADCTCTNVNILDTTGTNRAGTANLEVFICENVWDPTFNAAYWDLLQYSSNNVVTKTHLKEKNNNIGLFYCRDAGQPGVADDLPKLRDVSIGVADPNAVNRWGVYFDDTNDWLKVFDAEISNNINFDNAGQSWTVEAWVFNDIMPAGFYKRVFYKNIVNNSGNNNIQLYLEASGASRVAGFGITNGPVNLRKVGNIPLQLGFNHLALAYNGGTKTAELFVNGVKAVLSGSGPATYVGNKDFYIGSRGEVAGTSFGGYIDDMRIWSVAKTAPQILNDYNKILRGNEQNLAAYWTLNRDLSDRKNGGNNNLTAACTQTAADRDHCTGAAFKFINLSTLAQDAGLPVGVQMVTIQNEEFNQCADGLDNDKNGLIDMNDPKCLGGGKWEDPKLLAQYFFKRTNDDGSSDGSSDIISLRIYANPEGLPPDLWYQNYAPNPAANTKRIEADCTWDDDNLVRTCYLGAKDDASTYIAAGNVVVNGANKNIYSNIYLLGYSTGSDDKTLNIYKQLVDFVRFNQNLGVNLTKSSVVQDTRRVSDIVYLRKLIETYKATNGNKLPALAGGTYLRGRSLSVWPSWQEEFGKALGATLPIDPDNHFRWNSATAGGAGEPCGTTEKCASNAFQCVIPGKYCVQCAKTGSFAKETCYSSVSQTFSNDYDDQEQDNPLYAYRTNAAGSCYELKHRLETLAAGYTYNVVPALNFAQCH